MTRRERVRYEMLLRVRDFGTTHRDVFPAASAAGEVFSTVEQATAQIEGHVTTKLVAARSGRQTRWAARDALRAAMLAVARTARAHARMAPGYENRFLIPVRRSDVVLLAAARGFAEKAAAAEASFVQLGLAPTFIDDLRRLADTFEGEMAVRRAARADLAASQAAMTAALAAGANAVRILDAIVANVAGDNPALAAAWRRDRLVVEGITRRAPADRPLHAAGGGAAPVATSSGEATQAV
jgi:hypothetical protein